ncbi:MAG: VCBS repeat-containing protein [Candidatus Eisenbacteria bacterium]|uniref:VCBS repeat-containing protein n=1 Tax=Eiseniibacteriota bacterium TaxID=2212470 RepID=A0A948S3C4_UNCEI|nr:VCBS repeat-containing protein [Candidatus Eisenbacteria bacterium]MBU1949656.1 VCBS repeat-containing protein [Candidatus Eisenbacteria bacterium]MBU2693049.1 VCBS repeat-containing protein [Candidatus Eisenbacteria bacterium]
MPPLRPHHLVVAVSLLLLTLAVPSQASITFTDIGAGLEGVYLSSVAWGDYDNDGDLDIALTGRSNPVGFTNVYRNDGSTANTPSGSEICSAMADLACGYRRIVRLGNTNHNTSWTITLPDPPAAAAPGFFGKVEISKAISLPPPPITCYSALGSTPAI